MPEQESSQEFELPDSEVGKRARLSPLLAHDSNADVGCLNHVDIISAVSNRQRRLVLADALDEGDKRCLLFRRRAVDHEAFRLKERFDQRLPLLALLVVHCFDRVDQHLNSSSADEEIFFASRVQNLVDHEVNVLVELDFYKLSLTAQNAAR